MIEPWPRTAVGDLVRKGEAALQTGPFGTQLSASEYVSEGIPVINVRNVGFGDVRDDDLEYVSEAKADQLHHHILRKGDIVFGRKGAVERHALIGDEQDGWVQGSDCLRLRLRSLRFSERFVSFYLRTQAHQDWMQALCAFGATMSSLNQDIVSRIQLPCPPRPVQNHIAAILAAYDDLIANNQRRIALLESMAEEIYREWFVRMRFPGADRSKFRKGLPAGWSRKSLRQVADIDPFEARRPGEAAPFVPMDRLSTLSMYFDAAETRSDWAGAKFRNHDVLLPRITPSLENGKRGYVLCLEDDEVAVGSTEFIVLRAKLIAPEHLYFVSISDGFRKHAELSMSGASGRQRVQDDCFSFFLIAVPPPEITKAFVEVIRPFFTQVFNMARQTKRLADMRDALLPRLISGKLRVDHLDIQYPPSMKAELEQAE